MFLEETSCRFVSRTALQSHAWPARKTSPKSKAPASVGKPRSRHQYGTYAPDAVRSHARPGRVRVACAVPRQTGRPSHNRCFILPRNMTRRGSVVARSRIGAKSVKLSVTAICSSPHTTGDTELNRFRTAGQRGRAAPERHRRPIGTRVSALARGLSWPYDQRLMSIKIRLRPGGAPILKLYRYETKITFRYNFPLPRFAAPRQS